MHYYQFNIGDYSSHTAHLTPLEDIAYRRMIDWCYLHEKPLPSSVQEIGKKIRMQEHTDCIALVLEEFFVCKNNEYLHERIVQEIKNYKTLSNKRKKAANKRWAASGVTVKGDASALQVQSKSNANHKPLTINHKPVIRGRFTPPTLEQVKEYCDQRSNNVSPDMFIDHYTANGWVQGKGKPIKDWKACVRTWEKNGFSKKSTEEIYI